MVEGVTAQQDLLIMLANAVREGDRRQIRQIAATARAAAVPAALVEAMIDLGRPRTMPVRPQLEPDRRLARALELPLVSELEGRAVPLSPAAQRELGIGFEGTLLEAIERLTGLPRDLEELGALLEDARAAGVASATLRYGRARWRLHAFLGDRSELRVLAPQAGGHDERELERLATVNHEMANGLTALASLAAMARHPAQSPARIADALRRIEQTAHDTLAAVHSTRRALGSRPPSEVPTTDAGPLITDLLDSFASVAEERGVALECRVAEGLFTGARSADLRSIVWNLVKNAVEAVGEGGRVRVGASLTEDRVRLVVDDDGPGMTPETQRRAFEAYFTTKPRGNGLGLPLVRHLVERLGGELVVESAPGDGSRFVVSLPRREQLVAMPPSGIRERRPLLGLYVVLAGEAAESLGEALAEHGALVLDVRDALEKDAPVDVVIVDGEERGEMVAGGLRDLAERLVWLGDATPEPGLADAALPRDAGVDALVTVLQRLHGDRLAV